MLFRNLIAKLVVLYFLLLILFPLPLFQVAKYDFSATYLALISSLLLLPVIFFLSKSYWGNKITIIVWCLRVLMATIFLLASYRLVIGTIDMIPFVGTLALTFFYELGYFILSVGYFKKFLKYWTWISTIMCILLLSIVLFIIFQHGSINIPEIVSTLRTYHPSWPNYFGIYLVLLFWLVVYFSKENKRYFLLLLFIFPTLFFTFSRTAFLALFISVLCCLFLKRGKSLIPIILVLMLFILTSYVLFGTREAVSPGYSLRDAIELRQLRWGAAFSHWQERPFLGYGFRSFTEEVPEYLRPGGRLSPMGSSHNDYIDLLVRGGVLYSLFFWVFVLYLVWRGLIKKNNKEYLLKYLSYSIIALLVAALFQNPFKDPLILALFWSYVAAMAYYGQFDGKKFRSNNKNFHPKIRVRGY